ncbi:conserved hypothetical protein, membrane [Candidatus Magnetomorum sp. HK-1]|nr:conserved hypothetical protein, membrane [Candidatus Magnetomorum sp. HK-1]
MYYCQYIKGHRFQTIIAAADTIIPEYAGLSSAGTSETVGVMDWAIAQMPSNLRIQFLFFITIVYLMGFFFGGRSFDKNSPKDRIRQLKWMEKSKIRAFRMGFLGLKSYICMGYFTREDTWKDIHYNGPLIYDKTPPDPVIRNLCQRKLKVR